MHGSTYSGILFTTWISIGGGMVIPYEDQIRLTFQAAIPPFDNTSKVDNGASTLSMATTVTLISRCELANTQTLTVIQVVVGKAGKVVGLCVHARCEQITLLMKSPCARPQSL